MTVGELGQCPVENFRLNRAHQTPDVLALTRQRRSTAKSLRFQHRVEQFGGQLQLLQLRHAQQRQPYTELLQRFGLAFACRTTGSAAALLDSVLILIQRSERLALLQSAHQMMA